MCCNFRVAALKPGLCRGTRHSPGQESHHLSRPHSEAGLACSTRNAGWGPGAQGTFQGRPRARGASLRNSTFS